MANSSQADPYRQWHKESLVLHEIGTYLSQTKHPVEVRLPPALADLALNSWQREGFEEFIGVETSEQHRIRSEAASLALIGLALAQGFVQDGDEVIFQLDACFVGAAIEAADEIEARLDVEE